MSIRFQIVLRIRNVKPQTKGQSFLFRIVAKTGIQDVPGICLFSYILLLITFTFQRTPGSHRAWLPCGEIFLFLLLFSAKTAETPHWKSGFRNPDFGFAVEREIHKRISTLRYQFSGFHFHRSTGKSEKRFEKLSLRTAVWHAHA